jgi:hypothetical protein
MKSPRSVHIWLPGYFRARFRTAGPTPRNVWLMIGDHYEPLGGGADIQTARERVAAWRRTWPEIAARHHDSRGNCPRYTFFYPQEEYRAELLEPLAEMTRAGNSDVEIHIHHDGEGERDFVDRMEGFKQALHNRHGLLRTLQGRLVFAFIHGNWALDNSRPDGRYCGLNNELTLLRDLGCYADFTLPSAPNPTQTRIVNTIYWAVDDPLRPKSHDHGTPAVPGGNQHGDLLMIPGPLGFRLGGDGRLIPRVDMGELAGYDLPSRERVRVWLKIAPRLGDNIFIKLYTHGAQERNLVPLLNGSLDHLFEAMQAECAAAGLSLHYATAWEMYQQVSKALASPAMESNGI